MNWDLPLVDHVICGVEITINSDGTYTGNYAVLKKSKSKIITEISGIQLKDLNELFLSIDHKIPVLLSIKGKGIIFKSIGASPDENFESLLNKILPNSSIDEFYVLKIGPNDANSMVSVARKNLIDPILKSFRDKSYKVIGCVFGPVYVQSVLPLLISEAECTSELKFSNHELLIRNGIIVNYLSLAIDEPSRKIAQGGIEIDSNLLVAYACAFSYFNPVQTVNSNILSIVEAFIEFKNEVKFRKTGIIVLAVSFSLLLFNFIIYSYLADEIKAKSSKVAFSSSEMRMIDSLKSQIEERTALLSRSGLSEPSRTSYYADEIARDLPDVITLTNINIQPLKKNEDDEKKTQFENKKILVSGKSKFSLDVNEWIRKMRTKDWINSITLLNYKQREGDELGQFLLEIKMK